MLKLFKNAIDSAIIDQESQRIPKNPKESQRIPKDPQRIPKNSWETGGGRFLLVEKVERDAKIIQKFNRFFNNR